MKRFLLPLIAALALPTAVNAGIPENKNSTKWVKISKTFKINTEDVEVKKGKLRFYVERTAYKEEIANSSGRYSWEGKIRINCDKFTAIIQEQDSFGWDYSLGGWREIKPNSLPHDLANYFCFATGAEGYTRELEEPEWVSKIIGNIEMKKIMKKKKIGNINCNSPVWKNKPRCN